MLSSPPQMAGYIIHREKASLRVSKLSDLTILMSQVLGISPVAAFLLTSRNRVFLLWAGNLNPAPDHANLSMFRLAELRVCSRRDDEICEQYCPVLNALTDQQRRALETLSIRALGCCSTSTVKRLLPKQERSTNDLGGIASVQLKQGDAQELALGTTATAMNDSSETNKGARACEVVTVSKVHYWENSSFQFLAPIDNLVYELRPLQGRSRQPV